MAPKTKKTDNIEEMTKMTKKDEAVIVTKPVKTLKVVIPSKGAKSAKKVGVVSSAKKVAVVSPAEPASVVTPVKVARQAKPVTAHEKVAEMKTNLPTSNIELDMSKPKRLSAGQRTFIRRLKQIARQEGTAYHAPFINRRSTAK